MNINKKELGEKERNDNMCTIHRETIDANLRDEKIEEKKEK